MLFQNISKRKLKEYMISFGTDDERKRRPPRYITQLSIWSGGLGIIDMSTQSNSRKIIWIERLLNSTTALWKNLMLYRLNLILNSNLGLPLFRQIEILRSNRHENLQKRNNEDLFIQLVNAGLHFTNKKFPTPCL